MRFLVVLMASSALTARGRRPGPRQPGARQDAAVPTPRTSRNPALQGGDTIATATVIPGTAVQRHRHDGRLHRRLRRDLLRTPARAPDVVYRYTAAADVTGINIYLCGSTYDTEAVRLRRRPEPDRLQRRLLLRRPAAVRLQAGERARSIAGSTYYIVVDGYGAASGTYVLDVGLVHAAASSTARPAAVARANRRLVDDYVDNYNGGCNTPPATPSSTRRRGDRPPATRSSAA